MDAYLHPGRHLYKMRLEGKVDLGVLEQSFSTRIVKGSDGWPEPELSGSARVKGALGRAISKHTGDVDFHLTANKVSFENKDQFVII